jgi:hypothetical protein
LTLNMPGMEGSPVFGENSDFIGILIRPLRQKSTGAEIQVTWNNSQFECLNYLIVNRSHKF